MQKIPKTTAETLILSEINSQDFEKHFLVRCFKSRFQNLLGHRGRVLDASEIFSIRIFLQQATF